MSANGSLTLWDEVSRSWLSCLPKIVVFVAACFLAVLVMDVTGDLVFLVDMKVLVGYVKSVLDDCFTGNASQTLIMLASGLMYLPPKPRLSQNICPHTAGSCWCDTLENSTDLCLRIVALLGSCGS